MKGIFWTGLQKMGGDFEFDWVVMNKRFNVDSLIDELKFNDNDDDIKKFYKK